jgi:hypothetical protein
MTLMGFVPARGTAAGTVATGALPRNVDVAIKTNTARAFADANLAVFDDGLGHGIMSAASLGDLAHKFTVEIKYGR